VDSLTTHLADLPLHGYLLSFLTTPRNNPSTRSRQRERMPVLSIFVFWLNSRADSKGVAIGPVNRRYCTYTSTIKQIPPIRLHMFVLLPNLWAFFCLSHLLAPESFVFATPWRLRLFLLLIRSTEDGNSLLSYNPHKVCYVSVQFQPAFPALFPPSPPVAIFSSPAADHNSHLQCAENTVSNVDFHLYSQTTPGVDLRFLRLLWSL